jgi:hypothetical protein
MRMKGGLREMSKEQSAIVSQQEKIARELFDIDKKDDFGKDQKEIQDAINNINLTANGSSGESLLDFYNIMRINSYNDENKSKNMNAKAQQVKKAENRHHVEEMLSRENVTRLLEYEKDRLQRYGDYELIYSYIPQMAEAINVFRDCILSPDDLTKSVLPVFYGKESVSTSNTKDDVIRNIYKLKEKYDLDIKAKTIIRKTLTNGDEFQAILRYDEEFNKMLLNENSEADSVIIDSEKEEEYVVHKEEIEIDDSLKYVAEALLEEKNRDIDDSKDKISIENIYSDIQKEISESINRNVKFDSDPKKMLLKVNSDGFNSFNKANSKRNKKEEMIESISGSIIRRLRPENVVKLEVDGINFGYIYIEKDQELDTYTKNSSINDFFNSRSDIERDKFKEREEVISDIFVKGIAKKIDNKLIMDNKEFKDQMYVLLKQNYITNKRINITYLTPDEVVHFKTETDGIYGQSKYSRSLFFAKLYLATLITELMQKISRGRDKRLIYVETGLDEDIEGVVQGVVKDIKSKEIQTDVLKSITTILSSIGVFDDYYIPLTDGEKPLDFDTLQGMDVSADTEFLQNLLRSAIGGTGLPMNYVDASQEVDFSRSLAMQNSTFVRTIVSDQASLAPGFSKMIRILYKNEFLHDIENKKAKSEEENVVLEEMKVRFPAPISLNLTNVNDQISNSMQTVDFITSAYIDETEGDTSMKLEFKKQVVREFLPNIDWDLMDSLYDKAQMNKTKEDLKKDNPTGDGGDLSLGGGGGGFDM